MYVTVSFGFSSFSFFVSFKSFRRFVDQTLIFSSTFFIVFTSGPNQYFHYFAIQWYHQPELCRSKTLNTYVLKPSMLLDSHSHVHRISSVWLTLQKRLIFKWSVDGATFHLKTYNFRLLVLCSFPHINATFFCFFNNVVNI